MSRAPASAQGGFLRRLAYPAHPGLLALLAGLGVLLLLANLPGLLGLAFQLAYLVMAYKLAVEALVNTAHGRYQPLGAEELFATDGDAVRQLVLQWLVLAGVIATTYWLGRAAGAFALLASLTLLPAATMLLAVEGHFAAALNPASWLRLIGRIGGDYLALVLQLCLLAAVEAALAWRLGTLPHGMGSLPIGIAGAWLLIVGFHLMGDLLHRHAAALGLDTRPAIARSTFATPLEDEAVAAAQALADRGDAGAAAERLRLLFRGRDASHEVHERYRDFLARAGDWDELRRHDQAFLQRLLASQQSAKALAIAGEDIARIPGFRVDDAATSLALSRLAAARGQPRLVLALGEDAESRFAGAPECFELVLSAARVMLDRQGQAREAAARLRSLLAQSPGHPLADEARVLAQLAERVST